MPARLSTMKLPPVSDDAAPEDLEIEPEGFWDAVRAQVASWTQEAPGAEGSD